MTVVWKQGLYNYKDPFSLSAQVWPQQGEKEIATQQQKEEDTWSCSSVEEDFLNIKLGH